MSPEPLHASAPPIVQVQSFIDRFIDASMRQLNVLEAGCGSLSNIKLGSNVHIVGIDLSAEALAQNVTLHERVQADLEAADLRESQYDLIVCWDVLEHLSQPSVVIHKFLRAVRPGGLVLLALPNVLSPKSLIAKCTPLSFHLLVHRFLYGQRAGTAPGYEVCPTYLRYSLAPRSLARTAVHHGFHIDFFSTYESGMHRRFREKLGLVGSLWSLVANVVRIVSGGTVVADATDCILLLRRPTLTGTSSSPGCKDEVHPKSIARCGMTPRLSNGGQL